MKKFGKIGAVLTALVLGLICFVACSNNSGGGSDNSGGTNSGGGNSNNEEVETPKVTVVAEWKSRNDNRYTYKFYSDETYEYLDNTDIKATGKYYGASSPKQLGKITIVQEYKRDTDSGKLIPSTANYSINILKDSINGLLYLTDDYRNYDLVE